MSFIPEDYEPLSYDARTDAVNNGTEVYVETDELIARGVLKRAAYGGYKVTLDYSASIYLPDTFKTYGPKPKRFVGYEDGQYVAWMNDWQELQFVYLVDGTTGSNRLDDKIYCLFKRVN